MRLLLDTATLIFAVEAPARLSKRAHEALQDTGNVREFSAVSMAEIAVKNTLGKLALSADDVRRALDDMIIRVMPFTSDHAYRLFDLPLHHRDPFDRQIIAQALREQIPIVTPDRIFRLYDGLKLIW